MHRWTNRKKNTAIEQYYSKHMLTFTCIRNMKKAEPSSTEGIARNKDNFDFVNT